MRWQLLVPVKPAGSAKTRLVGATRDPARHPDLVEAIQRDTLVALLGVGPIVAGVHLVATPGLDRRLLPDSALGLIDDEGLDLNAALALAAGRIVRDSPGSAVAVVVADLPSLRAEDVRVVLADAEATPRGFVADAEGTGTTMLTALDPIRLHPLFGAGSAARHLDDGAVALSAPERARADVDTPTDLARCLQLGVGRHTALAAAFT